MARNITVRSIVLTGRHLFLSALWIFSHFITMRGTLWYHSDLQIACNVKYTDASAADTNSTQQKHETFRIVASKLVEFWSRNK
jgi:hypothetical protein